VRAMFVDLLHPGTGRPVQLPSCIWGYYIRSVSAEDELFATSWNGYPAVATQIDVVAYGLRDGAGHLRRYTVHLPRGAELCDVVFSTSGSRIAWLLRFKEKSPMLSMLQRIAPVLLGKLATDTQGVWISNVDGSNIHEIGTVTTRDRDAFGPEVLFLRWLPGAKDLSFVCGSTLYTIPAL